MIIRKAKRKRYSKNYRAIRTGAADPCRYKTRYFIPGTTKYTVEEELTELLKNKENRYMLQ